MATIPKLRCMVSGSRVCRRHWHRGAVVPDRRRMGIGADFVPCLGIHGPNPLRRNRIALLVDHDVGTRVAAARRVDTPKVSWTLTRLGILPGGDVDATIINHGRGHDRVAPAFARLAPNRLFRVAVELPKQLGFAIGGGFGQEAVHPAVSAGKDRLRYPAQDRRSR